MNHVVDGELIAKVGPTEDWPPDVFSFTFESGEANLCLRCAVTRSMNGAKWTGGMEPRVDTECEDCGNAA